LGVKGSFTHAIFHCVLAVQLGEQFIVILNYPAADIASHPDSSFVCILCLKWRENAARNHADKSRVQMKLWGESYKALIIFCLHSQREAKNVYPLFIFKLYFSPSILPD
jgi:hypothetical protein